MFLEFNILSNFVINVIYIFFAHCIKMLVNLAFHIFINVTM
jgi:hypothetical protein